MRVCICIYIYKYTHMYIYIYIYTHICQLYSVWQVVVFIGTFSGPMLGPPLIINILIYIYIYIYICILIGPLRCIFISSLYPLYIILVGREQFGRGLAGVCETSTRPTCGQCRTHPLPHDFIVHGHGQSECNRPVK